MNSNDRNIIGKNKLQELVNQIDPRYALDHEVEEVIFINTCIVLKKCVQLLLEVADEFIETVTTIGCNLAKHRNSEQLEAKDLQLHLEKDWGIKVPGTTDFNSPLHTFRRTPMLDSHKQRLGLTRRAQHQFQKQVDKQKQQRQGLNPSK